MVNKFFCQHSLRGSRLLSLCKRNAVRGEPVKPGASRFLELYKEKEMLLQAFRPGEASKVLLPPWNPESEEVGLVANVACWACYAISVRSTTSELGEAMAAKLQLHPARAAQEGGQSCSRVLRVDVDSALAAMGTPPVAQSLIVQYAAPKKR